MGRSGYSEDWDGDGLPPELYRNAVERSIKGKRGQSFFKEIARLMDEMPEKRLIAGELIDSKGQCCTMGVIAKARGIDVSKIDYEDADEVAKHMKIAPSLAREIAFENDDDFGYQTNGKETPEQRWERMRKFVERNINPCLK